MLTVNKYNLNIRKIEVAIVALKHGKRKIEIKQQGKICQQTVESTLTSTTHKCMSLETISAHRNSTGIDTLFYIRCVQECLFSRRSVYSSPATNQC